MLGLAEKMEGGKMEGGERGGDNVGKKKKNTGDQIVRRIFFRELFTATFLFPIDQLPP